MSAAARSRRGRWIVGAAAATAIAVSTGVVWQMRGQPSPEPSFPADSDVYEAIAGPIPPGRAGDTDVLIEPYGVASNLADVMLSDPDSGDQRRGTLTENTTLSLKNVTVRLCATWRKEPPVFDWREDEDGSTEYSWHLYYFVSDDGTDPVCPAREN